MVTIVIMITQKMFSKLCSHKTQRPFKLHQRVTQNISSDTKNARLHHFTKALTLGKMRSWEQKPWKTSKVRGRKPQKFYKYRPTKWRRRLLGPSSQLYRTLANPFYLFPSSTIKDNTTHLLVSFQETEISPLKHNTFQMTECEGTEYKCNW